MTGRQRTHIGHIERGLTNPTLALADDLARALEISLSVMIIEAEKIRGTVEAVPVRYGRRIDHWRQTNTRGRRNRE